MDSIKAYVTEAEKAEITNRAKNAHLSVSAFVKTKVLT